MTERFLRHYLKQLKKELALTNSQISKLLSISSDRIGKMDSGEIAVFDLSIREYQALIEAKDYPSDYCHKLYLTTEGSLTQRLSNLVLKTLKDTGLTEAQLCDRLQIFKVELDDIIDARFRFEDFRLSSFRSLLELNKFLSKTVTEYFLNPILTAKFLSPKQARFKRFLEDLRLDMGLSTDAELARRLGVAKGTLSYWMNGQTPFGNIGLKHYYSLAELRGWTLDKLLNYVNGTQHYDSRQSFEGILEGYKNLPYLQQLKFSRLAIAHIERKIIFESSKEFSQILKDAIVTNNWTNREAAKNLKIGTDARLKELLERRDLPSNPEILKMVNSGYLTKPDGEKYSVEELLEIVSRTI